jgi:hypothetical protein
MTPTFIMHNNISNVETVHMLATTTHFWVVELILLLQQIMVRLRICNLWLYKIKLQLWSHIVKAWIVGVYFVVNDNLPRWILKTWRCCSVSFVEWSKQKSMISFNNLLYEKVLSNHYYRTCL